MEWNAGKVVDLIFTVNLRVCEVYSQMGIGRE